MDLEKKLTAELRGTIESARERGYIPTYFLQMLDKHGGKETAKRLLSDSKPQPGLFRLHELGLLDESLEAIVLKDEYAGFIDEIYRKEARRRLEELRYFS